MTTAITQAPFPGGTKVRLIRDIDASWDSRGRARAAGFEFIVEDYVAANEAERGVAFYWGSANGGLNNVTVPADAVTLVLTAGQMAARELPTVTQFRDAIGVELCGLDTDIFETDATASDGEDAVIISGETTDGLRFTARVRVESISHADF